MNIVGSMLAGGGKVISLLANTAKLGKVGQFIYYAGEGLDLVDGLYLTIAGAERLAEIIDSDMTPAQKKVAMVKAVSSLILGGYLLANVRGLKNVDEVLSTQKSIVNKHKNSISDASNNEKGAWGEMATDVHLVDNSYTPIHPRKMDISEGWGESGIDHIFKKNGEYFIVESKYTGYSKLKMTADGKQMSDPWIQGSNRLDDILGSTIAEELRITGNYQRILAKVNPDGTIVYKTLDANAKIIGNFTP